MQSQKSRFENVLTILPQGHDEALKKAFYNIAALLFVIIVSAIAVAIYYILQPFLRPLLWALLCGTFLFPFKHHLATSSKKWLHGMHSSGMPLCIGIFILPFSFINNLLNWVVDTCWKNKKVILLCCICVPSTVLCVHLWPIPPLTRLLFTLVQYSGTAINAFSSIWIWSMVAIFIGLLVLFPPNKLTLFLKFLSTILWVAVTLNLFATLNPPFVISSSVIIMLLASIGVFTMLANFKQTASITEDDNNARNHRGMLQEDKEEHMETSKQAVGRHTDSPARTLVRADSSLSMFPNRSFSDSCLVLVVWSLLLIHFFISTFLLSIIPFMAVLVAMKVLGNYLELGRVMEGWVMARVAMLKSHMHHPKSKLNILMPRPVSFFFKAVLTGDTKVMQVIEGSIDKLSSAFIIFILLFSILFFTIFSGLEVHKESMHLLQVSSNLLNKSQHPVLSHWLPDDDVMQNAVDSMVSNAYLYGREWIIKQLKGLLHDEHGEKCQHIENQVLKLWDTLYTAWVQKNHTSSVHEFVAIRLFNHTNLPILKQRLHHYRPSLINIISDNLDPLLSLLESVWSVLVSNVSLTLKLLATVISILFGGGTAILNTLLSMVIFLTTLFYILASSGMQYKPIEILSSLGLSQSDNAKNFKFGRAFQDAIGSVFVVSLKMGAFYGLYTWFTHVVFGVQIIFIPSAMAASFAVVPFVGTYVAAFPGVVELWLIQDQPIHALLLFLAHYLPTFVIDTAFYSEIRGGHPLLTGLAILGGLYWMGLEGAIIGPVLLCCFVVAVHMYQDMIRCV